MICTHPENVRTVIFLFEKGVTPLPPFRNALRLGKKCELMRCSLSIIIFTSLRERDKREKSEEKIDCHHQDSNQGPSLVASNALTTELWCSRHPSRDCSTFSSDFVTHTSCESTQAGGTQPSLYPHTSRTL